MVEKVFR